MHGQKHRVFRFKNFIAGRKRAEERQNHHFFDEIQQCIEILTAIKFLVEDGSYRYILSGSLLGVELVGIKSAPVGYLSTMNMFPLDFGEFLTALNVQPQLLSTLRKHYEERKPVDSIVHEKLIEIFYLYLVIGGMPAAVQSFVDIGDFMDVAVIHKKIIEQYKGRFHQV